MEVAPGIEFIKFCKRDPQERIRLLPNMLSVKDVVLENEEAADKINYVLDFIYWWDGDYHSFHDEIHQSTLNHDKEIDYYDIGFFWRISALLSTIRYKSIFNSNLHRKFTSGQCFAQKNNRVLFILDMLGYFIETWYHKR